MSLTEKKIAILCNALAGNGKASQLTNRISKELALRNICCTVFDEKWPEQFENFTDVFIVGGDGTLNYFINHYPNISLPLVIFGGGTGNDFCWMLYGDITFDQQLETALTAEAKPVDIGRCNEKYFINGVGIGFD